MDHDLVQHVRQKVLWNLHLLYSVHCLIDVLAVGVVCHQCFLKWRGNAGNYSHTRTHTHTQLLCKREVRREKLTVILCNSSFVGGAFLVDFAAFS